MRMSLTPTIDSNKNSRKHPINKSLTSNFKKKQNSLQIISQITPKTTQKITSFPNLLNQIKTNENKDNTETKSDYIIKTEISEKNDYKSDSTPRNEYKILSEKQSLVSFKKSKFLQTPIIERRNTITAHNVLQHHKQYSSLEDKNYFQILKTFKEKEDPSKKTIQLKVSARFRPYNQLEIDLQKSGEEKSNYQIISDKTISFVRSHDTFFFTFDHIFDVNALQKDLYNEVGRETIDEVLKGYNGTIFTYGQSGSGKTYTMYGTDINDPDSKGIIPRALDHIFDFIDDEKNKNVKFEIKFSLLEIYQEKLYDLLNFEPDSDNISEKDKLKIKENSHKGIYIQNLTEEYVTDLDEFFMMLEQAEKFRVVSETYLNKTSSRSHLLMKLEIIQKLPDGLEKRGILNLVDLAGSEKVSKTGASGETLEEAKKINLSLSALGKVISALATSNEAGFVPYRDSKLTRILKDSLGGNFKTTLIVTCSPHIYNADESLSTLNFAQRAKKIKTTVGMNVKRSPEDLENIIKQLNEELRLIRNEMTMLVNDRDTNIKVNAISLTSEMLKIHSDDESSMSDNTITQTDKIIKNSSNDDDSINISTKIQNEELKQLKDEIENLKFENRNLKKRLEYYTKDINDNKLIKDLENLVKFHVDEIKKMKDFELKLSNNFIIEENKNLRKKLEECTQNNFNYFQTDEEFQFANSELFFNDPSVFNINKKMKNLCASLKEVFCKIKNIPNSVNTEILKNSVIGTNTENKNDLVLNNNLNEVFESYASHYEMMFGNTKLYMNKILDGFVNKKNLFVNGKEDSKLKSSFINLTLLNQSYEKIIINFMNKLLLDVKKFCLSEFLKNENSKRFDSMMNLFDNYMDCLQFVKSVKFTEERRGSVKNRESFIKMIPKGQLVKPVRRKGSNFLNLEHIQNLSNKKIVNFNLKNSKEYLIFKNSFEGDIQESESEKERKVSNLNLLNSSNNIIRETSEEDENTDRKHWTRSAIRNNSIKHKRAYFNENNNQINNNSNNASSKSVSNFNLHQINVIKEKSELDNASSNCVVINKPLYTKSFLNSGSALIQSNDDNTLMMIKNELNLYKNYTNILQMEISKLKVVNSELENTLKEYKSQLPLDLTGFSKTISVLKILFDEEIKTQNIKIDLLSKTIDDILINKGTIDANNLESSHVLKNYFEKKKESILRNESNNFDIMSIAESYIKESGSATKKMDYIYFHGDLSSKNNISINFGTGLQSTFPGVSPLQRNLKNTLKGDYNSNTLESSDEFDSN